jgi:hypothetical protein
MVGPPVGTLGGFAAGHVLAVTGLLPAGGGLSALTLPVLLGVGSGIAGAALALWVAVRLLFAPGHRLLIGLLVGGAGLGTGLLVLVCEFTGVPGVSLWWVPVAMSGTMQLFGRDLPPLSHARVPRPPPGAPAPPRDGRP